MRTVQLTFIVSFVMALCGSIAFSSCTKNTYIEEFDTTRGIFGKVLLYNELGEPENDNSDVSIKVRCIDTINFNTETPTIWDTVFYASSDKSGNWEIRKPKGGWYFMEFSKDGYCKNTVYAHAYDTSRADTVANVYLTKPTEGVIEIDSIFLNNNVLEIYRTMYFTANYAEYSLASWFFFDTLPTVSPEKYAYAYVSGSSKASRNAEHKTVVYKSVDKLLECGIRYGSKVYVRAYCDNARAVSFQTAQNSWIFPNLLEGSKVFSFQMPEPDEE